MIFLLMFIVLMNGKPMQAYVSCSSKNYLFFFFLFTLSLHLCLHLSHLELSMSFDMGRHFCFHRIPSTISNRQLFEKRSGFSDLKVRWSIFWEFSNVLVFKNVYRMKRSRHFKIKFIWIVFIIERCIEYRYFVISNCQLTIIKWVDWHSHTLNSKQTVCLSTFAAIFIQKACKKD